MLSTSLTVQGQRPDGRATRVGRSMELHQKLLLSLGLVIFAGGAARADILELTERGAQEIAKIEQAHATEYGSTIIQQHVDPRAGSRFGFVRGMILVEHNEAGDLNFTAGGAT